jgi:D-alanyl-lipoteichoic acid acyltransferase DltB (MBOAT superfamily)
MLFSSFSFLFIFLPVVTIVYALVRVHLGPRYAQGFLLAASLFFYAYAKPAYLALLVGSILFNWIMARRMGPQTDDDEHAGGRKALLRLSIFANIAFLCTFKYLNFFLRGFAPLHFRIPALPDWTFPLGLSFFTLTQIMYLVDTYQGMNPPNSLFDHATLVSAFPYISAGPLVRSRTVVPQFTRFTMPGNRYDRAARGLYIFAMGLAKKVVFADTFARIADAGFGSPLHFSSLEAWIFALSYTFQLYFDFSGYSDMAVGCAWMLGIDIPQNFNAPYRSKSISEFWQRWHISLSNFITNYLYTPILFALGKPTINTAVVAILIAMAIAGLWHGPAWTFILFGFLHGIALAINQVWRKRKLKMADWLGWLLTFTFVCLSLVFFRSPNVPAALHLLKDMLPHANLLGTTDLKGVIPLTPFIIFRPVIIGIVLAFVFPSSQKLAESFQPNARTLLATAGLLLVSMFYMNSTVAKEFIYFGF